MIPANDLNGTLEHRLREQLPAARELRRRIHRSPDISGEEDATRAAVLAFLGPAPATPVAGTGALVRFGGPGPAIAVRAELDALPIIERTGVSWASHNQAMHACGHDVHLAAAAALASVADSLPMPLLLILQPREETMPSGAQEIVHSGLLTDHDVRAVIGAHVQPLLATGTVACTPGVVNASADQFTVRMHGRGGHGAYPHLGPDAVLAIAQFVVAVQQLTSRNSDPMVPTVVSVGAVEAGRSPNVRPEVASARGTVRAMSDDHRELLLSRLRAVADGVALATGCRAEIDLELGEPVLVNDPVLAARTRDLLRRGDLVPAADLRSCGADDFAFYAEKFPSLMMFVGTGADAGDLHGEHFLPAEHVVDDVARALGAGVLAAAEAVAADALP